MTPARKRRWFTFSLRTLFVVVTALAVWLGYQLNWIHQRHALLEFPKFTSYPGSRYPAGVQPPSAPGLLWLFGEPGLLFLCVGRSQDDSSRMAATTAEIQRARALFPEVEMFLYVDPSGELRELQESDTTL